MNNPKGMARTSRRKAEADYRIGANCKIADCLAPITRGEAYAWYQRPMGLSHTACVDRQKQETRRARPLDAGRSDADPVLCQEQLTRADSTGNRVID